MSGFQLFICQIFRWVVFPKGTRENGFDFIFFHSFSSSGENVHEKSYRSPCSRCWCAHILYLIYCGKCSLFGPRTEAEHTHDGRWRLPATTFQWVSAPLCCRPNFDVSEKKETKNHKRSLSWNFECRKDESKTYSSSINSALNTSIVWKLILYVLPLGRRMFEWKQSLLFSALYERRARDEKKETFWRAHLCVCVRGGASGLPWMQHHMK